MLVPQEVADTHEPGLPDKNKVDTHLVHLVESLPT